MTKTVILNETFVVEITRSRSKQNKMTTKLVVYKNGINFITYNAVYRSHGIHRENRRYLLHRQVLCSYKHKTINSWKDAKELIIQAIIYGTFL